MEQTTDIPASRISLSALLRARASDVSLADLWIGRVLLVAALGLVAWVGVVHALDQPIYGPIDEAYHAGYVQRVANTGIPPMLGRDEIILAHPTRAPGQVILPGPRAGTAGLPYGDHFQLPQGEAIQPPLYYYLLAPVAWFSTDVDKIYALRIVSCALNVLGVLLLFLMLRATLPRQPLAAGIAAVVLASFTGITQLLSQVQNDALLMPVCIALMWAFWHDVQKRRVSLLHGLLAGAAAATHLIAVPLGAVSLAFAAVYALGRIPRPRDLIPFVWPVVAYVTPLSTWVALNFYRYHSPFPTGRGRSRHHSRRHEHGDRVVQPDVPAAADRRVDHPAVVVRADVPAGPAGRAADGTPHGAVVRRTRARAVASATRGARDRDLGRALGRDVPAHLLRGRDERRARRLHG